MTYLGTGEDEDEPSIANRVEHHLAQDLYMESARARGYLNVRAAARWLSNRYDWDAEEEAIVSALRRYEPPERIEIEEGQRLLGEARYNLETGWALVESPATPELWSRLQTSEERIDRGSYRARLPGEERFRLVVGAEEAPEVANELGEATGQGEVEVREGVARLVLAFPEPGHRAMIASVVAVNLLGQNGLDVLGIHFTGQDATLFVDERNAVRVHALVESLQNLASPAPG